MEMRVDAARNSLHVGIKTRIVVGFLCMLALMAILAAIGLRYVADANQRLKNLSENNTVKAQLASEMHRALRERALSMHALPILGDPFDKDEEILRFNANGSAYLKARQQLEHMPLTPEESAILERIRVLTREAQPEVQAVVDMAVFVDRRDEIFDRIRHVALPKQRAISEQVSVLVQLQNRQTVTAVRNAEIAYANVRNWMVGLGATALLIGAFITWFVCQRVTCQTQQLAAQAMFDPLTGLANRTLLQNQLESAITESAREQRSFAVMLLDLDRFKPINDTLGHEVGDMVLREVATRLREVARSEDTVARLGGDEYVLLLRNIKEHDLPAVAAKVLEAFDKPFRCGNRSIDLGASLGASIYPSHAAEPSELVRFADSAMYAAKRSGVGYVLYSPTLSIFIKGREERVA